MAGWQHPGGNNVMPGAHQAVKLVYAELITWPGNASAPVAVQSASKERELEGAASAAGWAEQPRVSRGGRER